MRPATRRASSSRRTGRSSRSCASSAFARIRKTPSATPSTRSKRSTRSSSRNATTCPTRSTAASSRSTAKTSAAASALVFAVDLDDAAVDLVGQVVAFRDELRVLLFDRVDGVADGVFRIRAKAELAQLRELLPVRLELEARRVAGLIEKYT